MVRWGAIERAEIERGIGISLFLKHKVPASHGLSIMLDYAGLDFVSLDYVIDDNALVISTAKDLSKQYGETRLYRIGDILSHQSSIWPHARVSKSVRADVTEALKLVLMHALRNGGPVHFLGDVLIVREMPKGLARTENILMALRGSNLPQRPAEPTPTLPAMDRLISLKVEENDIQGILEYFKVAAGLNIFVNWRSLEGQGTERGTPVTADIQNVSVRTALKKVLALASTPAAPITYRVVDNVVYIASPRAFHYPVTSKPAALTDIAKWYGVAIGPKK